MIVLITDPSKSDIELAHITSEACRAVPPGGLAILLRDKSRDDAGVFALATRLRKITKDAGQLLVMHRDRAQLARDVGADRVTTAAAHSDDDVRHAIEKKIDWVLVSPIFATPEKGVPRGIEAIRNAAEIKGDRESPKIIALGGIDAKNAASCMHAGAQGVAVIRSILHAGDPGAATRALWKAIEPFVKFDS